MFGKQASHGKILGRLKHHLWLLVNGLIKSKEGFHQNFVR